MGVEREEESIHSRTMPAAVQVPRQVVRPPNTQSAASELQILIVVTVVQAASASHSVRCFTYVIVVNPHSVLTINTPILSTRAPSPGERKCYSWSLMGL